jgi:hypothetical protein
MAKEEIANYQVFHDWLEEEKVFLLGLQEESKDQTETLEMEYVQKLVNLDTSRYVIFSDRIGYSQVFQCKICCPCY